MSTARSPDDDDKRSSAELEEILERFEGGWRSGGAPSIDAFLTVDPIRRQALLFELARVDLEQRLARGEESNVLGYLVRYPNMAQDRGAVLDLFGAEFRARKARDASLTPEAFAERFPAYRDELMRLLREPSRARRRFPIHLNCPHCSNPIEIVAHSIDEELVCPSCGSSFRCDPDRTASWSKEKLPRLGKFELLEAVGRGAVGTVYRARDTELERNVAVKVPRSGRFALREDEDRFVREARNAAQLHHTGIVPVYEVGRGPDFPYIVSEFVEGVTLADALTARRFSFHESARLVLDIAAALDHAHTHGVVHRDLKPSNVMLSVDGMPRVMDFGLAKRDAGEITMTIEGQVLGTPAYMSPEQAAGEAHHVDGRSDIYSLGCILYELLTGDLPFRGNQRMLLYQVIHDEPRAPRTLNDRVPRDLETICLKAMSKDPARRYATAREMAGDLSCYLAGQPISARPTTRLERGVRWARRNAAVASLAAAVVAALLAGTAVSGYFAIEAGAQARQAIAERERAESGFRQARQAVDRYYTTVSESKLLDVPGLQPLRRELLESALEYYQTFIHENADDPAVQTELAATYARVADINNAVGAKEQSREAYQQAVDLYERLSREHPEKVAYRAALGANYRWLATMQRILGNRDEALGSSEKGIKIQEQLTRDEPNEADHQFNLGRSYSSIGTLHGEVGRSSKNLDAQIKATELLQKAVDMQPDNVDYAVRLAWTYGSLADAYRDAHRQNDNLAARVKAVELGEKILRDHPSRSGEHLSDQAGLYRGLGLVQMDRKQYSEAKASFEKAVAICEQIVRDNPAVVAYQNQLGLNYYSYGCMQRGLNQLGEAESAFRKAIGLGERLIRDAPATPGLHEGMRRIYADLAELLIQSGRVEEAKAIHGKEVEVLEKLIQIKPDVLDYQVILARSHGNFAGLQNKLNNTTAALAARKKALEIGEQLAAKSRTPPTVQSELASGYVFQNIDHRALGQMAEAEASTKRAIELFEKLVQDHPNQSSYRNNLGWAYAHHAYAQRDAGRRSEAEYSHRKGIEAREEALRQNPTSADFRSYLGWNYRNYSHVLRELGKVAEAEAACQRDVDLQAKNVEEWPKAVNYRRDLVTAYIDLAAAQSAAGHAAESIVSRHESAGILEALASDKSITEQDQYQLAWVYEQTQMTQHDLGQLAEAESSGKRMLEIREKLARDNATNTHYKDVLGWSYTQAAQFQRRDNKPAEAVESCRKAIGLLEPIVRDNPGFPKYRANLAWAHANLGVAQLNLGQNAEAEASHHAALAIRRKLADDSPADVSYLSEVAVSLEDLGYLFRDTDRLTDAEASFAKAIEVREAVAQDAANGSRYRARLANALAEHGNALALLGRWSESAQSYAKAVAAGDTSWGTMCQRALVELAAGSETDYRAACAALVEQHGDRAEPDAAFAVSLALIAGDKALDDMSPAPAAARRFADADPTNPVGVVLVAAAQFRAGETSQSPAVLAKALAGLDAASPDADKSETVVGRLIGATMLALAYRDAGDTQALARHLASLGKIIEQPLLNLEPSHDRLSRGTLVCIGQIARRQLTSLGASPAGDK